MPNDNAASSFQLLLGFYDFDSFDLITPCSSSFTKVVNSLTLCLTAQNAKNLLNHDTGASGTALLAPDWADFMLDINSHLSEPQILDYR